MRFVALLLPALPLFSQGVVVDSEEIRFQLAIPDPKGSLMEQMHQARGRIEAKHIFRYRAFVRPDADVGQFSGYLKSDVLSIVRVAGFPDKNQKIALEAVTKGGKNAAAGFVFVSGQGVSRNEQVPRVLPMVQATFNNVDTALKGSGHDPSDVLLLTCYLSSMDDIKDVQKLASARYPKALRNHLQIPLPYGKALVECEAIARAKKPFAFLNPEGLTKSPNFTQVAGISSPRIYFSSLHASNGCSEQGVREMFQSLDDAMKKSGASIKDAVFSYLYPSSDDGTNLTRKVRFEFYNKEQPPASTLVPFSGYEARNACAAVEVVAPMK
ncbi:MAG: RidA family protein [Bryobacterales bacterium]|nr:RidA family protein [Bryobacterales bacterium]